jgi:hypothetical protein
MWAGSTARTLDALHLAAARRAAVPFVSFDARQSTDARMSGLRLPGRPATDSPDDVQMKFKKQVLSLDSMRGSDLVKKFHVPCQAFHGWGVH